MQGEIADSDLKLLPLHKRRISLVMKAGTAADTAPDTANLFVLPHGTAGATATWKLMIGLLDVENPNASATAVQLYSSASSNAAFGSGTALLSSADASPAGSAAPLSVSGASTYQASTTTFVAASQSLVSGAKLARQFSALGGSGAALFVEMEEV